jgi:hypothetical protein
MWKVFIILFFLAACQGKVAPTPADQPSVPAPTAAGTTIDRAEDILGVWTLTSHPHYKSAYWLLRPDGTYTFSPNQDGGRPSESGKYWFEGGQLYIKDDFCPTPGKYTVMKQDRAGIPTLVISLVEDGCTARVRILTTSPEVWFGALQ